MRWLEVPNEWVVLEVMRAHSKNGQRFIEEVVVVDRFEKSIEAMHVMINYEKNNHIVNIAFSIPHVQT